MLPRAYSIDHANLLHLPPHAYGPRPHDFLSLYNTLPTLIGHAVLYTAAGTLLFFFRDPRAFARWFAVISSLLPAPPALFLFLFFVRFPDPLRVFVNMAPVNSRAARALAAAAAEAAVQKVFPDATPQTRHAVSLAASAATAAAAVHFHTSTPPSTPHRAAASRTSAAGVPTGHVRKERTAISLGDKIAYIRLYDRGVHTSLQSLVDTLHVPMSLDNARRICKPRERANLLARARSGESLDGVRLRRSRLTPWTRR